MAEQRDVEVVRVGMVEIMEAWLDNKPIQPAADRMPDHLKELAKALARSQCFQILHWAKVAQREGLDHAPRKRHDQIIRYFRSRNDA